MARLRIENVSVDFGGIHALRDVSFDLESGAIVGLIGPNGAGKSTLLNCISGITRPTQGRVMLDSTTLSALAPAMVARQGIGRVFQHPDLVVDLSVRDNLLIACHCGLTYGLFGELLMLPHVQREERAAARKVAGVLDRLGLSDSADTKVRSLPYGHRKLVGISDSCCSMSRSPGSTMPRSRGSVRCSPICAGSSASASWWSSTTCRSCRGCATGWRCSISGS
jgi:branched-chain amino acid transport system ATP-binding protein